MTDKKSFDRKTLEYALAELDQRAFAAGRIDRDNDTPTPSSTP